MRSRPAATFKKLDLYLQKGLANTWSVNDKV